MIFPRSVKKLSAAVATAGLIIGGGCTRDPQRNPALAPPDFTGPGAAGVCDAFPSPVVVVTLEVDTPNPKCLSVRGQQRLSVINHFAEDITGRLGGVRLLVPSGQQRTIKKTFDEFLQPGGHFMSTSAYGGKAYGVEIRYER